MVEEKEDMPEEKSDEDEDKDEDTKKVEVAPKKPAARSKITAYLKQSEERLEPRKLVSKMTPNDGIVLIVGVMFLITCFMPMLKESRWYWQLPAFLCALVVLATLFFTLVRNDKRKLMQLVSFAAAVAAFILYTFFAFGEHTGLLAVVPFLASFVVVIATLLTLVGRRVALLPLQPLEEEQEKEDEAKETEE